MASLTGRVMLTGLAGLTMNYSVTHRAHLKCFFFFFTVTELFLQSVANILQKFPRLDLTTLVKGFTGYEP